MLETDEFYDGSVNLDDIRVDGVEDQEFYGTLNTERIAEAYQMQDSIETDDYETLAREVGYGGTSASDYQAMADRVSQRKEAEKLARDAFNNTEPEKHRMAVYNSLKDIPVLGWWAKIATDLDRVAALGLSSGVDFLASAAQGSLTQIGEVIKSTGGIPMVGAPRGVMQVPMQEGQAEATREFLGIPNDPVGAIGEFRKNLPKNLGVDPDLAASNLGMVIQMGSTMSTGMAAIASNPALALNIFQSSAYQEAAEDYDRNAKNPNPEDRNRFALTVSLPQAALDFAVGGEATLAKLLVSGKGLVKKQIITQWALSIPKEGLTEAAQVEIMKTLANAEFDQDREHFDEETLVAFLAGGIGAGAFGSVISLGPFLNARATQILEANDFSPQAFETVAKNSTKEEFSSDENPVARAMKEAAYDGHSGAQDAIMQLSEGAKVRNEFKPSETITEAEKAKELASELMLEEGVRPVRETELPPNTLEDGIVPVRPGDPRDAGVVAGKLPKETVTDEIRIERITQKKNDIALNAKIAAKKVRERTAKKISEIKEKAGRSKRDQRDALVDQRNSITDAIRQVEQFQSDLNKSLPKENKIKGSVLAISQNSTIESLEKSLDKKLKTLESMFETEVTSIAKKKLNKAVKKFSTAVVKAEKGSKDTGITAEHAAKAKEYINIIGLGNESVETRSRIKKEFEELNRRIDESEEYEISEHDGDLIEAAVAPDLSKPAAAADYNFAKENLESILKEGKTQRQKKISEANKKAEIKSNIISSEISTRNKEKGKRSVGEVANIETNFNKFKRKGKLDLLDYRSISALLTGKRQSKLKTLIFEEIANAHSEGLVRSQEFSEFVDSLGKKLNVQMHSIGTTQVTTIGTRAMNLHEAMFVYGHSQNPRGRTHLAATEFGGVRLRGDVVKTVVDLLPKEHKAYVDSLIDYFDDSIYPRLNEIFKSRFGVDMPKEERYIPIKGLNAVSAGSNVFSDRINGALFNQNNQKARTGEAIGWGGSHLDLIGDIMSSVSNTEHVIATHGAVREADKIMSSRGVREEMAKRDPDLIKWVNNYMSVVARGTFNPPTGSIVAALSHLRQNVSAAMTAINVGSWTKTMAPVMAAKKDIDTASWVSVVSQPWRHSENYEFAKSKSNMMKARRHNNRIEVSELSEKMRSGRVIPGLSVTSKVAAGSKSVHNTFQELGWAVYGALDGASSTIVWTAKYQETINKGKTDAESVAAADDIVNTYFPSGRVDQLPAWFVSGGMERQLTTFTADMNKMLNLGFTGQQLRDGKLAEAIMFIAFPVIASSMYLAATDALNDTIKEEIGIKATTEDRQTQFAQDSGRYAVSQMVGGVPLLGQAIEGAAAKMMGDDVAAWQLGQYNLVVLSPLQDIYKERYASAVSKAFGVPGSNYWAPLIDKYIKEEL